MVKLTKETGEAVSFSVKGFVDAAKRTVKRFFAWCHRGLTWLENKALEKLDKCGKWAEKKVKERTEPEPEPEMTSGVIID